MPITCKICNRQFEKQINNKHLGSHQMTTFEYKEKFGNDSLSSPEYKAELSSKRTGEKNSMFGKKHSLETKQLISDKNIGKPAHNKNVPMAEQQKQILRDLALLRNEEYKKNGNHPSKNRVVTPETRLKSSISQKNYALTHHKEMSNRGKKAAETKLARGEDLAFFRGKTHSKESIEKIIASTKESRLKTRLETIERQELTIIECGYEILDKDSTSEYYRIKCKKCNKIFSITAQYFKPSKKPDTLCGLCPSDEFKKSKAELNILAYVKSLIPDLNVVSGDKTILRPKELDIYIPEKKIAIEYCGLNSHGEHPLDKRFSNQGKLSDYHIGKFTKCAENGISLITIFSNEWMESPEIIKSILANKLGVIELTIPARKCKIKEINSKIANTFLNQNHLQGSGKSHERFGLFYNDELVSVMTFMNGDSTTNNKNWQINRFASKLNYKIIGGASKLFKAFITKINPIHVDSYADRRYGSGTVYEKLGFILSNADNVTPSYWYIKGNKIYHRQSFQKKMLVKQGADPNKTEWEIMQERGYDRIWDCGHAKWKWTNPNIVIQETT
jgi:NUMOD3 motif